MLRIYDDRIFLAELLPVSTEIMLFNSHYHQVDRAINSMNFPMNMSELVTVGVYLAGFSRTARTEEIGEGIRQAGFAFSDHRRLLALGRSHFDLCRRHSIAALGSSYTRDFFEQRSMVVVSVSGNVEAQTAPRSNWWHNGWRFLVELSQNQNPLSRRH